MNNNNNINPSLFQNYTWNNIQNLYMGMDDDDHQHAMNPFTSSNYQLLHNLSSSQTKNRFLEQSHELQYQEDDQELEEELGAMKEMMYKIAAMQPVDIDPATVRKPKRRNVRISSDPQSVAARHRRERISEKIRILQRLVPGGTKMDTASMLDEAIRYVKFLKRQIRLLQSNQPPAPPPYIALPYNKNPSSSGLGSPLGIGGDGNEPALCFNREGKVC